MVKKINLAITDEDMAFYESVGADPKAILEGMNRQVIQILKRATSIYDGLSAYNEENVADAIVEAGLQLTEEREKRFRRNKEKYQKLHEQKMKSAGKKVKDCPKRKGN
jgi:hypothetical protein